MARVLYRRRAILRGIAQNTGGTVGAPSPPEAGTRGQGVGARKTSGATGGKGRGGRGALVSGQGPVAEVCHACRKDAARAKGRHGKHTMVPGVCRRYDPTLAE